jgi:hypothetical protein
VARGYLEGPASEERIEALDRGEGTESTGPAGRLAVYGSTEDDPERHFLGWRDEIDPDELFDAGRAWGLSVRRRLD